MSTVVISDPIESFCQLVFRGIKRALELDGHCKAYEGTITVRYPSYFARQGRGFLCAPQDTYVIELACYVLGPSRGYEWEGATLDEAIGKATADVEQWIVELEDEDAPEPGEREEAWWQATPSESR